MLQLAGLTRAGVIRASIAAGAAWILERTGAGAATGAASPNAGNDVVVKRSRYGYSETIARLSKAIADAGIKIFDTVDQTAAAASVGLTLRPTTLLVFGNPKAGTLFMQAFPLIGLDLPLKLLIFQEGDVVSVAYVPFSAIAARYGITGMDPQIASIDRALDTLVSSVAPES